MSKLDTLIQDLVIANRILAREDVVDLLVHVAMGTRAVASGNLRQQRRHDVRVEADPWVHDGCHAAHARLAEGFRRFEFGI